MKCLECGNKTFDYDENMGEQYCSSCGLIMVTELFEETVSVQRNEEIVHSPDKMALGSITSGFSKIAKNNRRYSSKDSHIRKGIVLSQMVLSSVGINDNSLRDRVAEVYRELYRKAVFSRANTLEVRGTAVVWYVLTENRTPISVMNASKEFGCSGKSLNRLIRRIKSHYGSKIKTLRADPQYLLKKAAYLITDDIVFVSQCMKTLEFFEPIVEKLEYNKRNAYYESICWISKNIFVYPRITLKSIAERSDVSWSAIQKQTKDLLGLIGLSTCAQVKGKQISELRRE
jgi:transcription initiation factor TFIIIB Brf1 subunit/transcription initiation factor TFIIB